MKKTRRKKNKSALTKALAREKDTKLVLNKTLKEAFIQFLECHPAKRFSKNLRRMLLMHLSHLEAVESIYLDETLRDLEGLFNLLDIVEEEWKPVSNIIKHNDP
jgi:hypothetical protein